MINIATIGSNFIVHQFLTACKQVEGINVLGVYSRTANVGQALAEEYGVNLVYTNLEDLAKNEDIDAVYVASPNALHKEQSILMMSHGKHVLCEKPIASHVKEFEEMVSVAATHGVVLMEAMKSVHCPGFIAVKENLYKLGMIRQVAFNFSQYSSRYDKFKQGIVENAFKPELSNGALMDIGVYPIHMMLELFGMPKNIHASGVKLSNGVDGSGSIICAYEDFIATLIYSKIATFEGNVIQGEDATMEIDKISDISQITIKYRDGRCETVEVTKEMTMIYEIQTFSHAIKSGKMNQLLDTSRMQMSVLDIAREQIGIVFPADVDTV